MIRDNKPHGDDTPERAAERAANLADEIARLTENRKYREAPIDHAKRADEAEAALRGARNEHMIALASVEVKASADAKAMQDRIAQLEREVDTLRARLLKTAEDAMIPEAAPPEFVKAPGMGHPMQVDFDPMPIKE